MQLNEDQLRAIDQGEVVPVVVNQMDCVLVRADVFQSRRSEFDPRDTYAAVLKAWDADDDDPAQYQEYLRDE